MARFRYAMENILSIKERLEEQKRMELGIATLAFEDERAREESCRQALELSLSGFYDNQNGSTNATKLQRLSSQVAYEEKALKAQQKKVASARNKLELAREALKKAMEERKIQEKLKERAYEQFMEEEKQKEQQILDEVVGYKYAAGQEERDE